MLKLCRTGPNDAEKSTPTPMNSIITYPKLFSFSLEFILVWGAGRGKETNIKDCWQDLETVVSSSTLGSIMFSSTLKTVAGERVYKLLETRLPQLNELATIGDEALVLWLKETLTQLEAVQGVELLDGHRQWSLSYRGLSVSVVCKTASRFAELALRMALRE
eukprot:1641833-Amphidinium_carterae.1